MGVVAKELGGKILKFLIADCIAWLAWKGIKNKIDGKTVFGKKVEQTKDKTYVDWKGNIVLGSQDGWVA